MNTQRRRRRQTMVKLAAVGIWAAGVAALAAPGCQSEPPATRPATEESASAAPRKVLGLFPPPPERSGAQLWADNCMRCHYARSPQQYSQAQWDVIVHHMRLRADLTGEEQRKITEFLKAAD